MKRVYRKFKEQRAKQMEERRLFNRIQRERNHTHGNNDEDWHSINSFSTPSSPPPYSSAPTLAEIEKHESEQNLQIPLRSTSITSTSMYPTLSHNDITSSTTFDQSNRPLRNSQIYNTDENISLHEYILPPFECKKRRPTTISIENTEIPKFKDLSNPKLNFVTVKKSRTELIRPSWFNRYILQQPTLQIVKTVELKVLADRKSEFQKFSFYQLKKFKGAQESDHVSIYNSPKNCKIR
uniref:Uncharacterized protein n=1 Tax=Panagrolaimus davidi TaxID=227884 RepID=A0A914QJ23_9BILA